MKKTRPPPVQLSGEQTLTKKNLNSSRKMIEKIQTVLIGAGGLTAIAETPQLVAKLPIDVPTLVETLMQLAVCIATIIGIFKRKTTKA